MKLRVLVKKGNSGKAVNGLVFYKNARPFGNVIFQIYVHKNNQEGEWVDVPVFFEE